MHSFFGAVYALSSDKVQLLEDAILMFPALGTNAPIQPDPEASLTKNSSRPLPSANNIVHAHMHTHTQVCTHKSAYNEH